MSSSSAFVWSERDFFESLEASSGSGELSEGKIEEIFKSEHKGEIFKAIINCRKLKVLRQLTEYVEKFVDNVGLNLWTELINLSAEKEFFEIYEELKKFEEVYERNLNSKIDYAYKKVLVDISQLHADISDANISEIEKFIEKYKKLKLCYGSENFCALERSIEARQFYTYAFLRAKGFYSDKGQVLKNKIEKLSLIDKEEIRVEILKFTKPDPIGLILTKCELDAASDFLNFNDIRQMLEDLIKVKEIKPVLDILALSDVKIIFDYNERSVVAMDPTADEFTIGYAYFKEGILYVGRNSSKNQRYGTFAHEATHFALNLIYENYCLPYRVEDEERERIWVEIVEYIKEIYERDPEGTDNIVKWVYICYSAGYQQKAELIVRVNDLLAFYHDNPQKCEEVRRIYAQLFDFYRDFVLPDLCGDFFKIIKLNNDLKLFEDIKVSNFQVKDCENFLLLDFKKNSNFLLLSDVSQLTLSKVFKEISQKSSNKLEAKVKNIFINFERLEQENLKEELEKILKSSELLRIVIHLKVDESQKVEQNLKFLLNLKSSTQIFLIVYFSCEPVMNVLNKIFNIEDSKVEIESGNFKEVEETLQNSQNPSLKFLKILLKHSWNDLTEKSQKEILKIKIKFRCESFPVASLFPLNLTPSAETLNILSSQKNFQVQPQEPEKLKLFIERKFLKQKSLNFEEFIDESRGDKVVVISDVAGSGKTTLLRKAHQSLNAKFPNFWISFVSLLKHKKLLSDHHQLCENFTEILTDKIFAFNELEKKIFNLKYESDQFVILFDGFDEISPMCKKNALKLFELHKKTEKSQIWITTRTHLEVDLESCLRVNAHKLEPLSNEEQIEFLCEYWREVCNESKLRQKCAKLLVNKISEMNREKPSLIGLSLQIRLLAEYLKETLCENFDEKLQNLNFYKVYEFLIEKSVNIKNENSVHDILKLHSDIYEVLAIKEYLSDDEHHLFGRASIVEDLDEEKLEELSRGGIIFYDKDKEIFFLHRTVLEFFVWRFMCNRVKNFKKNWKYEKDFFELLLKLLSSDMTRLDECFKELLKTIDESQKNFENLKNFSQSFHAFILTKEKIDNFISKPHSLNRPENENVNRPEVIRTVDFNWIEKALESAITHSTIFVLKCLKFENLETFKKIIEGTNSYWTDSYFLTFLRNVTDSEICGEFLDEVFEIYPENSELFDFLMKKSLINKSCNGKIFYDIIDENYFKPQIFNKFWSKLEQRTLEYEKVLQIFNARDFFSSTKSFFSSAIFKRGDDQEKSDDQIDSLIKVVQRNLKIEDQRKLLDDVKLGFCKFEKPFLRILKFIKEILEPEEVLKLLTSVDDNGETILHNAVKTSSQGFLQIIFDEIQKLEASEKFLKDFLLKRNGSDKISLLCCDFKSENFIYLFDDIFLKCLSFKEFAYAVDYNGWNVLHYLVSDGDFKTFEHFINRAQIELSNEEFKEFCKIKTKRLQNIFHLIAQKGYWHWENDKVKLIFELLLRVFTTEEIRQFLSELDSENKLPLHHVSRNYKYNDESEPEHSTFLIIIELYEKNFTSEEILSFLEIKDQSGKNVLEISENHKNVREAHKKFTENINDS